MMPFMLQKTPHKQYYIMFMCSKSLNTMNKKEVDRIHGSWCFEAWRAESGGSKEDFNFICSILFLLCICFQKPKAKQPNAVASLEFITLLLVIFLALYLKKKIRMKNKDEDPVCQDEISMGMWSPWSCAGHNPHGHGHDCDVLTIWTSAKSMNRAGQSNFRSWWQLSYGILQIFIVWALTKFLLGAIWLWTILRTRARRKEGFRPATFLILIYMKPVQIWITVLDL